MDDQGEDRRPELLVVSVVLLFLSTLAVGLWFASRYLASNGERSCGSELKFRDQTILISLLLSFGLYASVQFNIQWGLGRHVSVVDKSDLLAFFKNLFVFDILLNVCLLTTKLSLLSYYWTQFSEDTKSFCTILRIIGFSVLVFFVGQLMEDIFQCSPIQYTWDRNIVGECLSQPQWYTSIPAYLNTAVDISLLVLPLPVIRYSYLSTPQILGLIPMFIIGGSACAASILRIVHMTMRGSPDITWQSVDATIFTIAESHLSLTATCLPTLGPLLRRIWSGKRSSPEDEFGPNYLFYPAMTSDSRIGHNSLGLGINTETRAYGDWKHLSASETKERKYMSPHVIKVQSSWSVDQEV